MFPCSLLTLSYDRIDSLRHRNLVCILEKYEKVKIFGTSVRGKGIWAEGCQQNDLLHYVLNYTVPSH